MPAATMKRSVLTLLLCLAATSALAWGEKGHSITTRAASLTLPNDMPRFFYDAGSALEYLGDEPDRWRNAICVLEVEEVIRSILGFERLAAAAPPVRLVALVFERGTGVVEEARHVVG